VEHLRFDCFEEQPHYHYVDYASNINRIVRIDEIAVGDPIAWTVQCLRTRLAEMIAYAGDEALASKVTDNHVAVQSAVEEVAALLETARAKVHDSRQLRFGQGAVT
jgi:hypothetical protein